MYRKIVATMSKKGRNGQLIQAETMIMGVLLEKSVVGEVRRTAFVPRQKLKTRRGNAEVQ